MATTHPDPRLAPSTDAHPAGFDDVRIGDTLFFDDGRILKIHKIDPAMDRRELDELACADLLVPLGQDPYVRIKRREYDRHTVRARPEYAVVYTENGRRWARWATRALLDGNLGVQLADKAAVGTITDLEVLLGDRFRTGYTDVTYTFAHLA